MNENYNFNVRVTGILIEDEEILVVKQKLSELRNWSLPGGRLERGETVRFIPIKELTNYGFSEMFKRRVEQDFPDRGNYMGDKKNIGLGN